MRKNKIMIILAALAMLLASCSNEDTQINAENETEITQVPTEAATDTLAPTDTPEVTPTSTPEPSKPKYIFIVIGDGFGRGAMTLGEIYSRIEGEDMQQAASWEDFDYQSYVRAMGESASGGTAISCGIETDPWYIGKDLDRNEMYTIMDRAKENGFATGVVTNSSLVDATPATFLSHTVDRYAFTGIARDFETSNVDYIAGGGLVYTMADGMEYLYNDRDSLGYTPTLKGPNDVLPALEEMGYETYLGMEGAVSMAEGIENNTFTPEKSIGIYTGGVMPFEYYKYRSPGSTLYDHVPSLVDMTEAGIQSLSQNENGFVMMIEGALIDKCGHKYNQEMYAYQVALLEHTVDHLIEFYNQHPDETLIILTADHETGNFNYDDDKLAEWEALPNFQWFDDGGDMSTYLTQEWGLSTYGPNLQTQINVANIDRWETQNQNRARLNMEITLAVSEKVGTKMMNWDHSGQLVPLFVMGKESEEFEGSEHIKEIPITICEIMGWEALPEKLAEDK